MDGAREYRNGDSMKLQIRTDSRALVALGAVDTALYAVGGRSHKPLDMSKVCQALSRASLSYAKPQPWGLALHSHSAPTGPFQSSLGSWILATSSLSLGLRIPYL